MRAMGMAAAIGAEDSGFMSVPAIIRVHIILLITILIRHIRILPMDIQQVVRRAAIRRSFLLAVLMSMDSVHAGMRLFVPARSTVIRNA
jgi:hypothetical protein